MTLVRPAAPAPAAASPAAPDSPIVARSIISDSAGPAVQTTSVGAPAIPAPAIGPTGTPVIQRIDGSAPAPPPPVESEGHSEDDLDELAQALFGRFRGRLRREYLYEREAKGLIFDNV